MSTSKPIPQQDRPALNSTAREFSSTLGRALFQQKIQRILQSAKSSTGADGIAVSLLQGTEYVCEASTGLAPELGVAVRPGEGVCGRCLTELATVVQSGIEGEIRSVVAVPIVTNGKLQGLVAGFSLNESPFPAEVIQKFQSLADTILQEIEPQMIVELDPEKEDVLEQLGFQPSELSVVTVEDPNYLPDIVREVLEETPSNTVGASESETNEVLSELIGEQKEHQGTETEAQEILDFEDMQPPAAQREIANTEPGKRLASESPVTTPVVPEVDTNEVEKPFFHNTDPKRVRTTEDVLMDLVQQSLHVPPASGPGPRIETSADDVEQVATPAASIAAAAVATDTPVEVKVAASEEDTPGEVALLRRRLPAWALALGVAAILVVIIGVFLAFYLRKPSAAPVAQANIAAQGVSNPPALPISAGPAKTQGTQGTDLRPEVRPEDKSRQQPTRAPQQQEPMIVAANGAPPHPAGTAVDVDPTPLTGIAIKPSSINLPATSTEVVFGGRRSSGVIAAKLLRRVEPIYPAMARTMHLSGDVRMDITVAEDGHVKSVANVNGAPLLATSAVEAVRKWRYAPARQDGRPVESTVEVTIRFR